MVFCVALHLLKAWNPLKEKLLIAAARIAAKPGSNSRRRKSGLSIKMNVKVASNQSTGALCARAIRLWCREWFFMPSTKFGAVARLGDP